MTNQNLKLKTQKYILKYKIFINLVFIIYYLLPINYFPVNFVFAQVATSSAQPSIEVTHPPLPEFENDDSSPSVQENVGIVDSLDSLSSQVIYDSPNANGLDSSAKFKILPRIKKLSKKNFKADESPTITIENTNTQNSKINLFNANGQEVQINTEIVHDINPTIIKLLPPTKFKPGHYSLKITDPDGATSTQDFTWGVLAININKSLFLSGETAVISLAVLDESGMMVCDARLNLAIKNPEGVTKLLSTDDASIIRNKECSVKDYTTKPDYETSYQTGIIGNYDLTLTAETKNGTYSITDSFEVKNELTFDIERSSATRIYPPKNYPMKITISANWDFQGEIREIIPSDFVVSTHEATLAYKETKIVESSQTTDIVTKKGNSLVSPFTGSYPLTNDFGEEVEDPFLRNKYKEAGLRGHDGLDYAIPLGTPIYAVDGGRISYTGDVPYGTTVIIEHGWGKSYYGHLSEILVNQDQVISPGDTIGLSGSTGLSTGPHLHFGIKLKEFDNANGYYGKINPLPYLNSSSFVTNPQTVQIISWEVNLKKGDKLDLGYNFKAPQESPQLYLLGPLQIFQQSQTTNNQQLTINSSESTSNLSDHGRAELVTSESTSSAQFKTETTSINDSQLTIDNNELVFQESRQWQIAADAITFSNLGSSADPDINDGGDQTSYCNGNSNPPCVVSWTPPTSGLIVVFVYNRVAACGNVPTISGNSLTWTQIDTVCVDPGSSHRITLFGANASGSTAGATTVDLAGETQLGLMASFFLATGVDLSGGVAAAFVQTPDNNGTGLSGSVTLTAAANSNNRPIAAFTHQADEITSPDGAWTEADDFNGAGPLRGFDTQWDDDGFQDASASWSTSSPWVGMAAELKMESAGPTLEQIMRHGKWFDTSVDQPFTF